MSGDDVTRVAPTIVGARWTSSSRFVSRAYAGAEQASPNRARPVSLWDEREAAEVEAEPATRIRAEGP